jgi:hypothetical protein
MHSALSHTRSSRDARSRHRAWPGLSLPVLLLAGLLVLVLAPVTADAATITPHGSGALVWDQTDLANVQLANGVFVEPIAPTALTPVSRSVRLTSTISGGALQTASPYWGPVRFRGGIRFLKLTPAATWTQVTVTKLTFNIRTQSVRASINGQPLVVFAGVNEMGMTDHVFWSHGHKYVRIRGASLSYTPKSAAALKAAFGYTVPDAPQPFASLAEVIRLN